jgi:hypothetical protein
MTPRLRPFLACCFLLPVACYEYLPAPDPASLVGERVQLTLTDSGAVALASRVGSAAEAIEGDLVADSAGALVLSVALVRARGGTESDWRGERVVVPRPLVASIARRRFSRSRSTFAGALMTVGVVAITTGLRGGGASSGGVPTPGRTPGQ